MRRLIPTTQLPSGEEKGLDDARLLAEAAAPGGTEPFVRFNMVSSVDGAAVLDGASGGLSTAADRRLFAILRAVADAIVVGAGTVAVEGYGGELLSPELRAWRRARGLAERPVTVVLSASASLPPTAPVLTDARGPFLVLVSDGADATRVAALGRVAEVLGAGGATPAEVTAALAARGLRHLHHEGGPRVLGDYLAAGAVDSLCLSYSPLAAPGGGPGISARHGLSPVLPLRLHRLYEEDATLLADYRRAGEEA